MATLLALGLGLLGIAAFIGGFNPAELAGYVSADGTQIREKAHLLAGVAIGVAIGTLRRIPWFELPRRALAWLIANRRNFKWLGYGLACAAFLIFY